MLGCCCLVAKLYLTLQSMDCSLWAPLPKGFFREGYESGLPFPSPWPKKEIEKEKGQAVETELERAG